MDIAKLKAEDIAGHPDTGPYDADAEVAAGQLNAKNRTRPRPSMTGSEILNAVDAAEWVALTDTQRQVVWDIVHLGEVNPFGVEATLITNAFSGTGGLTIAALADARTEDVSRAVEIELGWVRPGNIVEARS